MADYRLTPRAKADLSDIWQSVAHDNEPAADRLLLRLFEKFALFSLHPEMGVARPDVADDARLIVEGRYLAIYEPAPYGILVVAVVHGMRDRDTWLD